MRYVIVLILGLIVGAGATIFLLGIPRAMSAPGAKVQAPEASGDPGGAVVVTLTSGFLDSLLESVFRDLGPPAFQLAETKVQPENSIIQNASFLQPCTNTVTLAQEGSNVKTQVQFAGGKDEYLPDTSVPVSRPGELFGLHESEVTSWNVGVNFHPTDVVGLGGNYGRDRYGSFQLSRNASPPPDPSWTDPSRNWTLDNDDEINNVYLYLDLLRAVRNTDIRFAYDFNDSDNSFVHGGPRVAALASLNQFIPLPTIENTWQRATADVRYFFTSRVGLGVGSYFEKLQIADFNTIDTNGPVGFAPATGEPRIDWLGGLIMGYGNRPYTGHTAYVRVLYRF